MSFGRSFAILMAWLFAALLPVATVAQVNPPPVRQSIDENGVDLYNQYLSASATDLSIGPNNGTGLSFTPIYFGNRTTSSFTTHNFVGAVSGSTSNPIVTMAGSSESFTASGSSFVADGPTGSTLQLVSGQYVYTLKDGTVVQFASALGKNYTYLTLLAVVSSVTKPNGIVTNFSYKSGQYTYCSFDYGGGCYQYTTVYLLRLQSVTNNAGYQIKFTYYSNTASDAGWVGISRATAINNAIEYCDPTADSCSLTQPWNYVQNSVSVGGTGSTTTQSDTWVDSASHGTVFTYTANYSTSVYTFGIRRYGRSIDDVLYTMNTYLVQSVTKGGQAWSYAASSDSSSNPVIRTVTDPASHTRIYRFSSYALLGSFTDELSNTTIYSYNSPTTIGSLNTITLPGTDANVITYGYYARYNVTSLTRSPKPSFGLSTTISTSAVYPSTCTTLATCNKPTSTTDERGKTTSYSYDSTTGAVTQVISPALGSGVHPTTNYGYTSLYAWFKNSSGSVVQAATPIVMPTTVSKCQTSLGCENTTDERRTTIAYEDHSAAGKSNLLAVTNKQGDGSNPAFSTTSYAYDNVGNVISVDGPRSGSADVTRIYYNASRQQTGIVGGDPDGSGGLLPQAVRVTYRSDGLASQVDQGTVATPTTDPSSLTVLQTVATDYDSYSRPRRQTLSASGTTYAETDTNYDALGRTNCTAKRLTLTSSYSDACTPGSGTNGPDRIVHTDYKNDSSVWKQQTGYGVAARDVVTYAYTPTGKVQTLTDARGNVTTYAYDAFDRAYKSTFPNSSYEQLTLDNGGLATLVRLRDGNTISANYDDLGHLTSKTPSVGAASYYGYNLLGTRTYARFGSASGSGITHNPYGINLSQTINNMSGTDRMVQNYYDATNGYISITLPGPTSGAGSNYISYYNDAIDRPYYATLNDTTYLYADARDISGRPGVLYRWVSGNWNNYTQYGYDGASRVNSAAHTFTSSSANVTYGYGYNPAGQITSQSRSNDSYAYGGFANANLGYTVNNLNQYTAAGSRSYSYDGRGNITGYSVGGTTIETYGYDLENRLTSVSGAHNGTLSYDPLGRLFSIVSGGNTTQFEYDGSNLIAEYDGSGNVLRRYAFGEGADRAMTWYEGSTYSSPRYLYTDHQGSVVAVTDSSGNVTNVNSYDEYGAPASGNVGRFQYTGQEWLAEIGMYYYKARMYSPQLGRFMQTDPIGYSAGPNMYNYVHSDPLNLTDPNGTDEIVVTAKSICDRPGNYCYKADYGAISAPVNFIDFSPLVLPPCAASDQCASLNSYLLDAYVKQQNKSCGPSSLLPHGFGLSVGAAGDAGVPGAAGATANGSAGVGAFYSGNAGASVGAFASGGAGAYAGGHSASAVSGAGPIAAGASVGVGVSGFITNAQSAQQLSGPFTTYSLNVGFGPIQGAISLSVGGGIYQLSVSPPAAGVSFGASASRVTTNTVATGGCY